MESKGIDQPVIIRLQSSIRHPGQDEETHELETLGRYIEKSNTSYLKYDEVANDQEIRTTVKMGNAEALIMRSGAVDMRLPFIADGERPGAYGNGPANFKLIVKTNRLELTEREDVLGGRFGVAYELHAEGALLGTYELIITYTEGTK